jgi:lysozyme
VDVTYGIDVSSAQGAIDWPAVKAAGLAFAYVKASEGLQTDGNSSARLAYYADNVAAAKAAGLLVGAYHFFRADLDSTSQANVFAYAVRLAGVALDLPPMLDVETEDDMSKDMITLRAGKCLTQLESLFGVSPLLYTYPSFADDFLDPQQLASYPLWIATYGADAVTSPQVPSYSPMLPDGWESYILWQYSDRGRLAGIDTDVDLDLFWGSRSDLAALGEPMTKKSWPGYW